MKAKKTDRRCRRSLHQSVFAARAATNFRIRWDHLGSSPPVATVRQAAFPAETLFPDFPNSKNGLEKRYSPDRVARRKIGRFPVFTCSVAELAVILPLDFAQAILLVPA
jgi:hypothetical protein